MRRIQWVRGGLVGGVVAGAALFFLSGCELLVDFDRSKIPEDSGVEPFDEAGGDATVSPDAGDGAASSNDAGDATVSDAPPAEAAVGLEAAPDSSQESSPSAEAAGPADTGSDVVDSTSPASDGSGEAAPPEAASLGEAASDSSSADDGG